MPKVSDKGGDVVARLDSPGSLPAFAEGHAEWMSFGAFTWWPRKGQLRRGTEPVKLGHRPLRLLAALLRNPGTVLSKQDLAHAVWDREIVEDATLRMAIMAIRRALGDEDERLVENVPGEGYRIALDADLQIWPPLDRGGSEHLRQSQTLHSGPQRAALAGVVGRDADFAAFAEVFEHSRLVTVVGLAGVGKTTFALRFAGMHAPGYAVTVADLASMRDPNLIPWQVALALGADHGMRDAPGWLLDYRVDAPHLLVLDNCEHGVTIVSNIAERLLAANPMLKLLATSREPLRVPVERVYRLECLGLPPAGVALTRDDIARYPALRLLFDRLGQTAGADGPTLVAIEHAASICRQVDGLPLAIELAARRAAVLGLASVADGLRGRLGLLTKAAQADDPRHGTLEAAFDWGYQLLDPALRAAFRWLSILPGTFTVARAAQLLDMTFERAATTLADLVDRSLLVVEGKAVVRFRQLESVRWFALDRLREAGEFDAVSRRHARIVRGHWRELSADAGTAYGQPPVLSPDEVADLMAALHWAMVSVEDMALARELVVAMLPLAEQLGLSATVLPMLQAATTAGIDDTARLTLLVALATAISMSDWSGNFQRELFHEATLLARRLGEIEQALQALWGLAITENTYHNPRGALAVGRQMAALAREHGYDVDAVMGDLLQANALYVMGQHARAEVIGREAIARLDAEARRITAERYHFDGLIVALANLAMTELATGRTDQAMHTARHALDSALAGGQIPSVFFALTHAACPVAIAGGDFVWADACLDLLRQVCTGAPGWQLWFDGFEATRHAVEQPTAASVARLAAFVGRNFLVRSNNFCGWFRMNLARVLLVSGAVAQARECALRLVEELEQSGEFWLLPTLLTLLGAASAMPLAAEFLAEAIRVGEAQGARLAVLEAALGWHAAEGDSAERRDTIAAALAECAGLPDDARVIRARSILASTPRS